MAVFDTNANGKLKWREFNKVLFDLCNMNDRCIETGRFYFKEAAGEKGYATKEDVQALMNEMQAEREAMEGP